MGCNRYKNVLNLLKGIVEYLGIMLSNLVKLVNGVVLDPQLDPVCSGSPKYHMAY